MKKNSFYGMMMFAAALLTAGCTADYADSSQGLVPIYLTATVNEGGQAGAATRAAADLQGAQLASGTTFAAEFTGSDVTVNSVTYTADGNGGTSSVAPSQPYFKLSGTSTTVHAYVPSKPSGTFSVQANQSGDDNYKASDLMYATGTVTKSGSSATGSLTFTHKMAKIIVNATVGDGISSITKVEIIGGYRTVNITDATTCALGTTLSNALSANSAITVYSGTHSAGTLNCAGLIPPQTINGAFLVVTTNMGDVTYSLSSKAFASGQSYTFNITVNAAAIGTTIAITNWGDNGSATVNPTVELTNAPSNAVAVDLGLSVKWANMNVGATAVTDYGTYFAWGETSGYTDESNYAKTYFSWDTYAWCKGTGTTLTKYCSTNQSSNWWDTEGNKVAADNKTQLELGDDAARANWGGKWRMPTQTEMQELVDTKSNTTDYTWTWCNGSTVKYNDTTVKGWKIESNKSGTAGNHIFLPAAGIRSNAVCNGQGVDGWYWSSSLRTGGPYSAWYLVVRSSGANMNGSNRYIGYTVRAVQSN